MRLFHLREPHGREMEIPLDGQTKRPSCVQEFGKAEVAKFPFQTDHPPEKHILAVKVG